MKDFPKCNMEDVISLTKDTSAFVEEKLKKFNIILTTEQEDRISKIIIAVLEEVSTGYYNNYN